MFAALFIRIANSPRLLVLTAIGILLLSSILYDVAEGKNMWDSAWWALITATTVGYGDAYPASMLGRIVASGLVISMVLFFVPMVTASFASKLIVDRNAFTHEEQEEMKEGIRILLARTEERSGA